MADDRSDLPDNVRSLADRAASNGHDEDPEPFEEFPVGVIQPADAKTLKNLIRGGLPVELQVSMMSAAILLPSIKSMVNNASEGCHAKRSEASKGVNCCRMMH